MICFRLSFVVLLAALTLGLLLVLCLSCEQSHAQESLARYAREAEDDNEDDNNDLDDQQAVDMKTTPKPRVRKTTTAKRNGGNNRKSTTTKRSNGRRTTTGRNEMRTSEKPSELGKPWLFPICIFRNNVLKTVYGLGQINFDPICHPGACHPKSRTKCPDDPFPPNFADFFTTPKPFNGTRGSTTKPGPKPPRPSSIPGPKPKPTRSSPGPGPGPKPPKSKPPRTPKPQPRDNDDFNDDQDDEDHNNVDQYDEDQDD